jgi:5'-methylthioadenosine phosphorylase
MMTKNAREQVRIGLIGGSGLYEMEELVDRKEIALSTPFGNPSAPYVVGNLRGQRVVFLARHGVGHKLLPSELNFRANIFGLKTLGVEWIVSASAVGSLQEKYKPLDIVIPDQFLDRTNGRISTFFGRGLAAHVTFANPLCSVLSCIAYDAAVSTGVTVHRGGTYVCMEGPQFSTLAESRLYRSWCMDIIGMTNLQEAKLAREAEICYTTLGLVTDYDCWHPDHDNVTVEMVVHNLLANAQTAKKVILNVLDKLPIERNCVCSKALSSAIITRQDVMAEQTKKDLEPIVGKYLNQ